MLQRLDTPILSLNTTGHTSKDTSIFQTEGLSTLWSVFRKNKNSLEIDRRQENLNWRLWRRGSGQSSSSSVTMDGDTWSNCSSYTSTSSPSLAASSNTLFHETCTNEPIEANNHAPKFYVSELEIDNAIHADQQRNENDTKDWQIDGSHSQHYDIDDEEDDDDMTLFGGDDIDHESSVEPLGSSCCEFTKKHPPVIDQRSLLSSMLLRHSASTSTLSFTAAPMNVMPTVFMVDVLSSSMKQSVQWEKKQNSGPAAGLLVHTNSDTPPFMIPRDSFDTFEGCW